jgi:hypothetical protein
MRAAIVLRDLSLGAAMAAFLLAAPGAFAATLEGGTARLDHSIDAQNARQGQRVEARLDGAVRSRSAGLDLPKGTELIGTVSAVQASQNGGASSMSLTFTKAQTKDGKTIPVKVTVVAAYPSSAGGADPYGEQAMAPPPRHISAQEKVDQESGILSHTSMMASAAGNRSATFRDKSGNVRLKAGTYLEVGIAPASGSSSMASGI